MDRLISISARTNQDKTKLEIRRQKRGAKQKERTDEALKGSAVAQERLAANSPGLRLVMGEALKTPESVFSTQGKKFLTKPSKQSREKIVRDFLGANAEMYGLTPREVAQLKKTADYTNPAGNLSWVELRQEINGRPVFQGEVRAVLTKDGELVGTVSRLDAGACKCRDECHEFGRLKGEPNHRRASSK